jgi:type 1 glutamine amidotransferase
MRLRVAGLPIAAALVMFSVDPLAQQPTAPPTAAPTAQAPAQPGAPAAPGRGGRRGGGDPFAGQPRIKALIVSGGCCHDYPGEARVMMDAIGRVLPVDWMVAVQGGRGTRGSMPVYDNPDWAKGFDIVVHNECLADVTDPAYIRRITAAHRNGPPAMVIHCSMHSYRAATIDDWREFLGVTSRRHTASHPIAVKITAKDHSIMKGFKEDWVTPVDELYVIDKFWPNARALASAVSPEDQKEYPLAWVNEYGGSTRVFGTTIGHGADTWNDPVYQDLLARGFKWAVKRE